MSIKQRRFSGILSHIIPFISKVFGKGVEKGSGKELREGGGGAKEFGYPISSEMSYRRVWHFQNPIYAFEEWLMNRLGYEVGYLVGFLLGVLIGTCLALAILRLLRII